MTGVSDFRQHFDSIAKSLRERDYIVFNPCDWDDYMIEQKLNYTEMLEIDLAYLRKCDIIYMLKGWEDSVGACVELLIALKDSLAIMFEDNNDYTSFSELEKHCYDVIRSVADTDPKRMIDLRVMLYEFGVKDI